jgi:sulfite oxidase
MNKGVMLGEQFLNSVICTPGEGERFREGALQVSGYATGDVDRVELSADGGRSWHNATLFGRENQWAWKFWDAALRLEPGEHQLTVRAWDSTGNTQPEHVAEIWNYRGYMNNAWHRIKIYVE